MLEFVGCNLKVLHRRRICNCSGTNTVSYKMCGSVCGMSADQTSLALLLQWFISDCSSHVRCFGRGNSRICKGTGEFIPFDAVKACRGSRGIAPLILNLSARWRWVFNVTSRELYPRERTPGTIWIGRWMGPGAGLDVRERRKMSCTCRDAYPGPSSP